MATPLIAADLQDYIAKFRESCRRHSVVVEGKTLLVSQAIPLWLRSLDSKQEQERQEAARNLAVAAIGGQLSYSGETADALLTKYEKTQLTNDASWEIKLNLLSALSEIGDPRLKNLLDRETTRGHPRLTRIARLVESKQYLLPTISSGVDVHDFIREQLGRDQPSTNHVIFQDQVISKEQALDKMVEIFSGTDPQAIQQAVDDWCRNPQIVKDTKAFDAVVSLFRRADQIKVAEAERILLKEQIVTLVAISGDSRAAKFLQDASQDNSDEVRRRAERELQRISQPK